MDDTAVACETQPLHSLVGPIPIADQLASADMAAPEWEGSISHQYFESI